MSEQQARIYGRGFGKLWPTLLENPRIDWKARLCFGVMGSFGPLAVASLKAIARRMGVKSHATVRQAQGVLVVEGWLYLIAEGAGRHPRAWWLADRPWEWIHDPEAKAELDAAIAAETARRNKGANKDGLHVVGSQDGGAPAGEHPKQETTFTPNQEQSGAAEAAAAPEAPAQRQALDPKKERLAARGRILGVFRAWWLAQAWAQGRTYVYGPGDGKLADKLVEAGVSADDLAGPLAAWLGKADDFTKGNGWPFWLFCRAFNGLQLAGAPARACIESILSWARCIDRPASLIDSEMPETASPILVSASAAV